ncbi:FAD-dependent thymidylate synthase [Micromonospora sp. CB01531]|uniref:FAD-dependent thymidylate synthase n=1 Tax=Micromonospora sp. CB01531 TaxID=1718947 RepID=UPI0009593DB2|nr:FAD-dependent thymidylate synthase [Micromonospora sp. CB01531]OKI54565.1 hypothetical protein A6A27_32070 [Micromonospora sp. CB01531]
MQVLTVASTHINYGTLRETGYIPHCDYLEDSEPFLDWSKIHPDEVLEAHEREYDAWLDQAYPKPIDELHEACGRGCYISNNRPNPATNTNQSYLGHIIEVDHLSVLGHGHVTLYVSGVSRALLLELERHQQRYSINFSVLSQRYVNHGVDSDIEVVHPPIFDDLLNAELDDWFLNAQARYDTAYTRLREQGYSVKESRGAARAFLPENTETRFFVTGSIRAWRNIIEQRLSPAADAEIREFARLVLAELEKIAPNSMQDVKIEGDK